MAPRFMTTIAIATFAAVACGQQQSTTQTGSSSSGPCNSGVCKLDVTVANDDCSNATNIKVVPDPLPVLKNSPNKIEWTIQTNGYTWVAAPGGITGLPPDIFTGPHDTGSGKKYDIHDKNPEQVPTPHKYAIHLQKGATLCAVLDPTIRNGS